MVYWSVVHLRYYKIIGFQDVTRSVIKVTIGYQVYLEYHLGVIFQANQNVQTGLIIILRRNYNYAHL